MMDPSEKRMQKTTWLYIALFGLLIIFVAGFIGVPYLSNLNLHADRPRLEELTPQQLQEISNMMALYIKGRSVLDLINAVLLIYLMVMYARIYRDTKTTFSLCLVLFSFTLLLYSISSNPLLIWVTGFQRANILGIFNFFPDIFTTLASLILIYLSRQ
jgi:hypothetical protein